MTSTLTTQERAFLGRMEEKYNPQERNAFLNATDCQYYGYGRSVWNTCGITDEARLKEIWHDAFTYLTDCGA